MSRFTLILLLVLFCAGVHAGEHFLIAIDDMRAEDIDSIPSLKKLAKKGVIFTNHHHVYPNSTATNLATLFSGTYPSSHGILADSVGPTAPEGPTFKHIRNKETAEKVLSRLVKDNKGTDTNYMIVSIPTGESSDFDLQAFLIAKGLKESTDSEDVRVERNELHVEANNRTMIRAITEALLQNDQVGVIYTQQARVTHPESFTQGALSFQSVYMEHENNPDILVQPMWKGSPQEAFSLQGVFVASGPAWKKGKSIDTPTANFDIMPTIRYLLREDDIGTGRVLYEGLKGGPDPEHVNVLRRRHGSQGNGRRTTITELSVDGVEYVSSLEVQKAN